MFEFNSEAYGADVAAILALDGNGSRLMPLAAGQCSSPGAKSRISKRTVRDLFPDAPAPEAALAGLWLYFSCLDESHKVAQDVNTLDGSFWHGIMHRQEPDAGNSGYWFRRVGSHPVFAALHGAAGEILQRSAPSGFKLGSRWDPFAFIDFCDEARQRPGSDEERLAQEIQRAEWQLLFDHCARPRS
jgi:hypothetical protein